MLTLFHYVHCPYCLRVRFAFGLLKVPYQSQVLGYHDEQTPLSLCAKKMLPIVRFSDGSAMNESLDIIEKLDTENLLKTKDFLNSKERTSFESLIDKLSSPIHNLVMPYWVYTQEFDTDSRKYFLAKKEKKRGPFNELMKKRPTFEKELSPILDKVEHWIDHHHHTFTPKELSIQDIMLASVLWGLYVLPEFQFSPELHLYLQHIKKKCHFEYHQDYFA